MVQLLNSIQWLKFGSAHNGATYLSPLLSKLVVNQIRILYSLLHDDNIPMWLLITS